MNDSKTTKNDIGFDYWRDLAEKNPELFEQKREQFLADFIQSSPNHVKRRLGGLQWQIDMERKRAKTPIQSAIKIYDMMWESLGENYRQLRKLQSLIDPEMEPIADEPVAEKASVLHFDQDKTEKKVKTPS
ncbi:MAG: DUF3135 domain-containing protein [Gammaproteobacteria bacterium]|nr:DUF3135 domain-containing protein [Gammaproteobacteria bacterium]MDH5730902.1 DUF3135 domain-containing protein [Gammaproteobacteria bacterium]